MLLSVGGKTKRRQKKKNGKEEMISRLTVNRPTCNYYSCPVPIQRFSGIALFQKKQKNKNNNKKKLTHPKQQSNSPERKAHPPPETASLTTAGTNTSSLSLPPNRWPSFETPAANLANVNPDDKEQLPNDGATTT